MGDALGVGYLLLRYEKCRENPGLTSHLVKANHYRNDREIAFTAWNEAVT